MLARIRVRSGSQRPAQGGPEQEGEMAHKHKLTPAERDERRARDRRRLQDAARQLLSSDGWRRWVRVRATNGLARYSLHNQLLIALACPHASFVAGFKAWLQLGYCVRKGEKAIRILAPVVGKDRDAETDEQRTFFRQVPVFDRSQVDPLPSGEAVALEPRHAPLTVAPEPPHDPLTGDTHAHLLRPLAYFAASLGYEVSFESLGGPADGWCDSK